MRMRWVRVWLPLLILAACGSAPPLPPGFAALAAEAPEDEPARLYVDGDRIASAAASLGPGGLPHEVRIAADAIAPGGRTVFTGREWGPRGSGWRIEKAYQDGKQEHFRSMLLGSDGSVLERSHSLPLSEVPQQVLLAAQAPARSDVQRVDIVSGPTAEEGYRVTVADRAGRTYLVACDLQGRSPVTWRVLMARIAVR
jgi:hypothetical protein